MKRVLLALGWAGVLVALSTVPNLATPHSTGEVVARKLGHVVLYLALGALVYRALPLRRFRVGTTLIISSVFALSDEWHQHFTHGRQASVYDVALDVVGAFIGAWIAHRLSRAQRAPTSPGST